MVKELFDTLDVSYEIYNDGKELIDALKDISISEIGLFITDLEMPVMGGREVIKIIRDDPNYDHIKLIVHTNMSNDIMEETLDDSGVDAIIGKVNMLKLGNAIKNMLI
jgi:two-component system chemotaxis response regulator CheV